MREGSERVEIPGAYVTLNFTMPVFLALCSFGPPSHALIVIVWRGVGYRYIMRFG